MKKLIIFVFLFSFILTAAEIKGTVQKVIDGDTIIILDEDQELIKTNNNNVKIILKGKYKVRLADIDAPETKQQFGLESKKYLEDLCLGKKVIIKFHQIDMYGRIVGTIIYKNESLNEQMVKDGFAWWFKDYSKKIWFYDLEQEAKSNKRGIWKEENNIPPWIFRKENKKK